MRIEQLNAERSGGGTLFVADEAAGIAVVIDPCEELSTYLRTAELRGLRLAHAFLTHLPDEDDARRFELWRKLGVTVHASAKVPRKQGLQPLLDGSSVRFGSLVLEFRHVEGPSPDALCILLYEVEEGATRPAGVVTRDYRLVA